MRFKEALYNLNPDLNEFLERKPNITVIGLYWAGYWRLLVAFGIVYTLIKLLIAIID